MTECSGDPSKGADQDEPKGLSRSLPLGFDSDRVLLVHVTSRAQRSVPPSVLPFFTVLSAR